MGCFDTLNFTCPACGKTTSEQSKAGDCGLDNFTLANAPLLVIADINDDGKKGRLYCEHCNAQLELEVRFVVMPRVKDAETTDDDWRSV